jgi:multiple sugar transport system ATP-binding protein
MAGIELTQVTKRFGNIVAVDSVSLSIRDGEFMVLVGPSGCGKTTVLRMLAGLADADAGSISFDGVDVTHEPPGQRNVAMVFQNYALFPHMTVERNLSFGLRLRRTPLAERRQQVDEVARLLRIDDLLHRFPRELSGGQKQRVALGRALIRRPVAFFFDEPLSNLDPALRVEMRAEIAALHKRYAITTVYVTHDQVEAMTMGDRLAVLNAGRVMQVGAPLEVYNNPQDAFTAGFIGSPAMNQLELDTMARDGRLYLLGADGLQLELSLDKIAMPAGELPPRVIMGLRPEHLHLCRADTPGALSGKVTLVEQLGREHIVYLSRGELSLRCIAGADAGAPAAPLPRLGETAHLACDLEHAHLFNRESGARIQPAPCA